MRGAEHPLRRAFAVLALMLAAGSAAADESSWMTVGDDTLADMRGGFDLGGGVTVSFGITRTVAVNGVLVATTSFQVPDIGRITSAQAAVFAKSVGGTGLIQVGTGNTLVTGVLPAAATVVQNTLNGQTISTRTLIDTTTNGMSLIKAINTGTALQDALHQAVR